MRVEKFSLFFPPTLWSKKVGETEYAIGSIPAGGYVKITGMNPDEDLPEEVRDRAYHAQPVWKRIVVIAAGPAVNLVLAFVLLFIFFALIGPHDRLERCRARSRRAIRRRACCSRATGWWRSTGSGARRSSSRSGSPATRCAAEAAHEGLQGRRARTDHGRGANGALRTFSITPIYDPRGQAHAARLRLRGRATRGPRRRRGARPDREPLLVHHQEHARAARPPDQPGAAQGDLGSGRLLRGHAPDDPQRRRGRDRDPRDHLALAGDREPVPVPAAGRRPHLLGDRGEGARQAGAAAA